MARSTELKNTLADSYASVAGKGSLHDGDPGTDGDNELAITRATISWGSSSGGVVSGTMSFTIASTTNVTHIGVWTTGGLFLEGVTNAITVPSGTYTVNLDYVEP